MKYSRIKIDSFNIEDTLTTKELSTLTLKKFTRGSIFYYTNSVNLLLFKSGKAKIVFYENGEEFILYYLLKNNIFILEESCVVEFLEDSEVYIVDARIFSEIFGNINFCNILLSSLVKSTILERNIIKNLVFENCKKRIASFMLDIALASGDQKNEGTFMHLDMSIKDLAKFIGSKRQTVSTVYNELLKEGILEKNEHNQYLIRDIEKLKYYTYQNC